MGVKGLWSLLSPVARPIKLETMEGKRLAIDSSIWLYQFQATMRDKDGRVLVNAHILGFLRRINKLLFHGIKPVFVFDGGAPALKRSTIAERKKKKAGAAASHAKVAEKLFAAQMRREAVKAAQAARDNQAKRANLPPGAEYEYQPEEGDLIEEGNAAYLDDDVRPAPVRSATGATDGDRAATPPPVDPAEAAAAAAAARRKKFKNHDPYRLPELPDGALAATRPGSSTTGARPDPRMATEEELVHFIEEMKPEDFDLTSPEFRALPTETQYEIIGDLRIRSRQQSHKRLASMLQAAPTPLDFSKAQIASLSQRNNLTQQLLTVTDTIGTSGLHIPLRVAAERNREYVLVRNSEAEGGGWVLGVRDQGTQNKPIVIEESPKKRRRIEGGVIRKRDASDEDEVEVIARPPAAAPDPELRAMRQRQMIDAFTRRHTPQKAKRNLTYDEQMGATEKTKGETPLFAPDDDEAGDVAPDSDEDMVAVVGETLQNPFDDDSVARKLQEEEFTKAPSPEIPDISEQMALEKSRREAARRRDEEDLALIRALKASKSDARLQFDAGEKEPSIAGTKSIASTIGDSDEDDFEEVEVPDLRVPTTEEPKAAGTEAHYFDLPIPAVASQGDDVIPLDSEDRSLIEAAILRDQAEQQQLTAQQATTMEDDASEMFVPISGILAEETTASPSSIPPSPPPARQEVQPASRPLDDTPRAKEPVRQTAEPAPGNGPSKTHEGTSLSLNTPLHREPAPARHAAAQFKTAHPAALSTENAMDQEESGTLKKTVAEETTFPVKAVYSPHSEENTNMDIQEDFVIGSNGLLTDPDPAPKVMPPPNRPAPPELQEPLPARTESPLREFNEAGNDNLSESDDELDDSRSLEWSLSPEPEGRSTEKRTFPTPPPDLEEDEGGIDMNAEGDDYARFLASIQHRNLEQVRQELDNEIRDLNQQNKVAMRDSEEITHQMVAQIQLLLRLFGIPYVTAPMEAEAQCAELARLNLVDGVITDDNDVFLFGASQCFKNLFNDAKYVECFLAADLAREMSLTRERLITIAYLLGSDYTEGLPGIGPVAGMEIMANFPGPQGLKNFKVWWTDVQQGKDDVETQTKWQKSFKKKHSDTLYLQGDWPNPAVRDAYNNPTVDSSDEPFHWGFPDLIGLRGFLQTELSWGVSKVDDELTPIIQRIARRGQAGAATRQTILDPFFDSSLGAGQFAPRIRTKHPSKRLQAVIRAYREAEARANGEDIPKGFGEMLADLDEPEPPLKSISEMGDVEATPAEADQDGARFKRKAPAKRKSKAANDDEPVKAKRAPRKRKTIDSAVDSEATGTSAAVGEDNETPPVSRRGSTRKRGAARGRGTTRGSKRGRSTSRASSTITSTTLANDHDQEDFDDDWGRSIDQAIANEMLEGSTASLNNAGTDKENNVPAKPASRPRPRKKQKVSTEAEE